MSWKAMIWTHKLRVGLSCTEYRTLMVLAEHAHENGSNSRPAVPTISEEAEIAERSVQRSLRVLIDAGLISESEPATRRLPAVWRLNMDLAITASVRGANVAPEGCQPVGPGVPACPKGGATLAPKPKTQPVHEPVIEPNTLASARAPKMAMRRSQLSEDWSPDPEDIAYAKSKGINVEVELERFKNHHLGKGTVMARPYGYWRNWCAKAADYGRAPQLPIQGSSAAASADDPWGAKAWAQATEPTIPETCAAWMFTGEGSALGLIASEICEAADIPPSIRPDLDLIVGWINLVPKSDYHLSEWPDMITAAIRSAQRRPDRPNLRWYDGIVRQLAERRRA